MSPSFILKFEMTRFLKTRLKRLILGSRMIFEWETNSEIWKDLMASQFNGNRKVCGKFERFQ